MKYVLIIFLFLSFSAIAQNAPTTESYLIKARRAANAGMAQHLIGATCFFVSTQVNSDYSIQPKYWVGAGIIFTTLGTINTFRAWHFVGKEGEKKTALYIKPNGLTYNF